MLSNPGSRLSLTLVFLLVAGALLAAPRPAVSQSCIFRNDNTPATPPPMNLWSGIEPTYAELPGPGGQTPGPTRDTTWDPRNGAFTLTNPYWYAIDIEANYLFAGVSKGFQIWNLSNPTNPSRTAQVHIDNIAVNNAHPHISEVVFDVAAALDEPDLAVLGGGHNVGIVVLDTNAAGGGAPRALYQDGGKVVGEVYATGEIGGRYYGYSVVGGGAERGVWTYDLTRAQQVGASSPCREELPGAPNPSCDDVFVTRLNQRSVAHIDGADDGSNHFVVFSGNNLDNKGFEIWNINQPASPSLVLSGLTSELVAGVAMWHQPSPNKFFLALVARGASGGNPRGQIYDVTCIRTGCGSLGSPIFEFPLAGQTAGHTPVVNFSRSSGSIGTPYLYFGAKGSTVNTGLQTEWLFDVTTPTSQLLDVTGADPRNGNTGQPTMTVDGIEVGYWSWFYACRPAQGSNWYRPHAGMVRGDYFYRAGRSILDIHRLVGINPTITVTGPSPGYTGQSLTFNASASGGCNPTSNGWSWDLDGGTGSSSTSSINAQWSSPGTYTVTASNTNCPGAQQQGATLQILDATPNIGNVTASPTTAPVCSQITFQANNVTGQPPLTFDWTIEQGGNPVPGEVGGNVNPFLWDTEGISPGTYRGRATVSGPGGSTNKLSPVVTLTSLDPLPQSGGFSITNDPPVLGSVQLHSSVAGATEWRWTFGDGDVLQTQDPVEGADPVHVYDEVGTYEVTLEVRNCVETDFRISQPLEVEIVEVQELEILAFEALPPANCSTGGVCLAPAGVPIPFLHNIEGDPEFYDYDWDGDGNFDQTSQSQLSHAYDDVGTYTPRLRVRRGAQNDTFTHQRPIVVEDDNPPSINISGPTSRDVGQSGNFSATASNCTPNSSGWTWDTDGGDGSSTSSSINIGWSTTGTKTITASNSACTGASDSHFVSVTEPGGGPGGLEAAFTFNPQSPGTGQQVSFDGSSSTGQVIDWSWDFGDGETGSGEQTTHVYDQPGTYTVGLTVAAPGECQAGICFASTTQQIAVGGVSNGDCVPDDKTLCLLDGRFAVTARWENQRNGETGDAKVYTPFSGNRTGMFWFFRPDNVELITKSLDGTNPEVFPEPAFWFFYGGLSDVEYWITVTDTANPEEEPKEYHNEPGVICGMPDTAAFPVEQEPEPEPLRTGGAAMSRALPSGDGGGFEIRSTSAGMSGTCEPDPTTLCLHDGRFAVEVDWHDHRSGDTGVGTPIVGTNRTGYFWFFNSDNVELVTKIIDGSTVNGHFWVLWGALSDVEYTIRVTDTVTQQFHDYHNPPGSFCGGASNNIFEAE